MKKKNMKKIIATILAMTAVSPIPTVSTTALALSEDNTVLYNLDFDSEVSRPTEFTLNDPTHWKYPCASAQITPVEQLSALTLIDLNGNVVSEGAEEIWAEQSVEYVQDPLAKTVSDRALKFNMNENTMLKEPGFTNPFNMDDYRNNVVVQEFNFMADKAFPKVHWILYDTNWNIVNPLSIINVDGEYWASKETDTNTFDKAIKLETNKWYNCQIVLDFTSIKTKTEDGTTVATASYPNIVTYVNGEKLSEFTIGDYGKWSTTSSDGTDPWIPRIFELRMYPDDTNESYGGVMYFDDMKAYTVGEETSIDIPELSDYSYMNGETVRLYAKPYLGNDYFCEPITKVEYYDNGVKIAQSTVAPYEVDYTPGFVGLHSITAKAYIETQDDMAICEKTTSFIVEPAYRETEIMNADFADYQNGTTDWVDGMSDETNQRLWQIRNIKTDGYPQKIKVDNAHGYSLDLGFDEMRRIDAYPQLTNTNNMTIKASMEIYTESLPNVNAANNVLLSLNASNDAVLLHSNTSENGIFMNNGMTGELLLANLVEDKWYKLDVITTVKNGQGYYTLYVDGKRVDKQAYAESASNPYLSITNLSSVLYYVGYNTGAQIYFDNLKLSQIEYYGNSGFYSNGTEIKTLDEMIGDIISVKTACTVPEEARQFAALYKDGKLVCVEEGEFDSRTGLFTVEMDIGAGKDSETGYYTDAEVKVFLWDGMRPVESRPESIR